MVEETEKANEQEDRMTQPRFLRGLRGKEVSVAFMHGKALKGELLDFDTYILFIRQQSGLELAIFKHAIRHVCLAGA